MIKYLGIIITAILTSFFFFPLSPVGMHSVNSKMIMAAFGLCIYLLNLAKRHQGILLKDTSILSLLALLVSLITYVSITLNNTPDYTYVSYIVSMWVWIGAAYVVITCIRLVHGAASVRLVGNYLVAVCVFQCLSALLIDNIPAVAGWIDKYFYVGQDYMENFNRLYGLGAALDVAGSRFAAVLVILAVLIVQVNENERNTLLPIYILSFIIISVVGNMIARTTTVGMLVAIVYIIYKTKPLYGQNTHFWAWIGAFSLLIVPLTIYFYSHNPEFRQDLRFAFEGFFSLIETGRWEVSSNKILSNMYVFPESPKTWIIGDGYFDNPDGKDPYFTGKVVAGFYMGTDVGYLRFIFYFGILGLAAISGVMYMASRIGQKRFPKYKELYWMLLLINFIVWFKVSTDIFPAFAPFLMIDTEEEEACECKQTLANASGGIEPST